MLLSKAFRTFGNRRATPLTSTSYTDRRATDNLPSWHSQLGSEGQVRCRRPAGHGTAWRKDPRPWTGNSHEGNPVAIVFSREVSYVEQCLSRRIITCVVRYHVAV
jgi:hypothetical protein